MSIPRSKSTEGSTTSVHKIKELEHMAIFGKFWLRSISRCYDVARSCKETCISILQPSHRNEYQVLAMSQTSWYAPQSKCISSAFPGWAHRVKPRKKTVCINSIVSNRAALLTHRMNKHLQDLAMSFYQARSAIDPILLTINCITYLIVTLLTTSLTLKAFAV